MLLLGASKCGIELFGVEMLVDGDTGLCNTLCAAAFNRDELIHRLLYTCIQ